MVGMKKSVGLILAVSLIIGTLMKIFRNVMEERLVEFEEEMKTVLITGGSTGLGLELAKKFAKNGKNKLIIMCFERCLDDPNEALGGTGAIVDQYEFDLSKIEEVKAKAMEIFEKHGKIDILVNNAGMVEFGYFNEREDISVLDRTMKVNFYAPVILTKAYLERFNSGHVVFISSVVAYSSGVRASEYVISKHALAGFQKTLATEMKSQKIPLRTTIVYPYLFSSDMFKTATPPSFLFGIFKHVDLSTVAERVYRGIAIQEEEIFIPFYWRIFSAAFVALPSWLGDAILLPIYQQILGNA